MHLIPDNLVDPPQEYHSLVLRILESHCKTLEYIKPEYKYLPQSPPSFKALLIDVYGTLVCSGVGDISISEETNEDSHFFTSVMCSLDNSSIWLSKAKNESILPSQLFRNLILESHRKSRLEGISYPEVNILQIWNQLLFQWGGEDLYNQLNLESIISIATRYECLVNPVWLYDGVETSLKSIRDAGIPIGIISNSQFYTPIMLEYFLKSSLEEFGIQQDISTWSYHEGIGKPSTDLYSIARGKVKSRFGLDPEDCLYLGNDMLKDVAASKSLGFKTGLFCGDTRSLRLRENEEKCKDVQPDWCFSDWSELIIQD